MIVRLIAGLAALALTGCSSASTDTGSPVGGTSSSCPPASPTPPTSYPPEQPPGTYPAVPVSAPATTWDDSSTAPGVPLDANTRNLAFSARCSGGIAEIVENIAIRVTITSTSKSAGDLRVVAHVAIVGGPQLLHYGPTDFHFIAGTGKIYNALTGTQPAGSNNILGRGTLVPGNEAQGDVIFDVPSGGGKITYTSEFGSTPVSWSVNS